MLSLPLPIVVVLFLGVFLARLIIHDRPWTRTRKIFVVLIGLCVLHGAITGFVWSYAFTALRPLLPIVASLLPVLTWYAFHSMAQDAHPSWPGVVLRLLPTAVLIPLAFTGTLLIDPIIIASYLFHGVSLIVLAANGPDAFQKARLHQSTSASQAARFAGILLIANAAVDVSIIVDFQMTGGQNVLGILSALSVVILLALGAASLKGTDAAENDDASPDPPQPAENGALTPDDMARILKITDAVLLERKLFTDPDLTLVKIARKAGLSARDISMAVNRQHSMNVSQYVNGFRLKEACQLLAGTDDSITNIHMDSGFQTKSNFNREFKRHYGCSPSAWRTERRRQKS
jgi:AraC-like DNA-binding protein